MLSLARRSKNQEQMAGRIPNPSFGSDCPGQKEFELMAGGGGVEGSHFTLEHGERQNCPLNPVPYLGEGCDPFVT